MSFPILRSDTCSESDAFHRNATDPDRPVQEQTLSGADWQCLAGPEDPDASARRLPAIWPAIVRLINQHLTERQRQVVELYYLRGLDQVGVAAVLGITQQSVNEHLFGKLCPGGGGLIPKLRKLCARACIAPCRRWVAEEIEDPSAIDLDALVD